jgi:hypothetical protein
VRHVTWRRGCRLQPVVVCFRVHRAVSFGQHVALVGKSALLGKWNIEDAVPMEWEEGDLWAVELDMHTWEMVRPCLSCALNPLPLLPVLLRVTPIPVIHMLREIWCPHSAPARKSRRCACEL